MAIGRKAFWADMTLSKPLLTIELPEATPSNNAIKGMHRFVYKKLRERWKQMVYDAVNALGVPPMKLQLCHLQIDRHCAGSLDWDNAYGGLKPLLDCLVAPTARNPDGLGLIRDDGPKFMPTAPEVKQFAAKKGCGKTVVRIFDLTA